MKKISNIKSIVFLCLLIFSGGWINASDSNEQIKQLISTSEPPSGVVFEIVSGDENYLAKALPLTHEHIKQLRERFPDLDIAIVTHGNEMFALSASGKQQFKTEHKQVQSLVADNVDVHVCGTYAEWNGLDSEAFPDYVDVSPSGPAQINMYKELGYILVRI